MTRTIIEDADRSTYNAERFRRVVDEGGQYTTYSDFFIRSPLIIIFAGSKSLEYLKDHYVAMEGKPISTEISYRFMGIGIHQTTLTPIAILFDNDRAQTYLVSLDCTI